MVTVFSVVERASASKRVQQVGPVERRAPSKLARMALSRDHGGISTLAVDGDARCPECNQNDGGIHLARWVDRKRVKKGLEPVAAIFGAAFQGYWFGDNVDCECEHLTYANRIRKS